MEFLSGGWGRCIPEGQVNWGPGRLSGRKEKDGQEPTLFLHAFLYMKAFGQSSSWLPSPQNPQGPSCWLPAHQEEISYGKVESLTQNSLSPFRGGSQTASPLSSAQVTRKCSLGSTRFAAWDLPHLPLLCCESPAQALHRVLLNHGVGCSAAPLTHTGCYPSPASRNVSGQIG